MAGTTTLGYPYPSAGDSMSDEATKVQELAQAVDDNVGLLKTGTKASGVLVAGAVTVVSVAFATPFPAAGPVPNVVACLTNVLGTAVYLVDVRNITRAGFDLAFLRSAGTAAMTAHWIAIAQ